MKKLGIVLCAVLLSSAAFSQVETVKKEEVKAVQKEVKIEREVKVTEENGVKTVEVTEILPGGEVKHEVFTGPAADKKLAELEKEEIKTNARGERAKVEKKVIVREAQPVNEKPKKLD